MFLAWHCSSGLLYPTLKCSTARIMDLCYISSASEVQLHSSIHISSQFSHIWPQIQQLPARAGSIRQNYTFNARFFVFRHCLRKFPMKRFESSIISQFSTHIGLIMQHKQVESPPSAYLASARCRFIAHPGKNAVC